MAQESSTLSEKLDSAEYLTPSEKPSSQDIEGFKQEQTAEGNTTEDEEVFPEGTLWGWMAVLGVSFMTWKIHEPWLWLTIRIGICPFCVYVRIHIVMGGKCNTFELFSWCWLNLFIFSDIPGILRECCADPQVSFGHVSGSLYYVFHEVEFPCLLTRAWIGSLQYSLIFLPVSCNGARLIPRLAAEMMHIILQGIISGRLFDAGYFRHLLAVGSLLFVAANLLIAECTQYWQFILCQGLAIGVSPSKVVWFTWLTDHGQLACGLMYVPCIGVVSQWCG